MRVIQCLLNGRLPVACSESKCAILWHWMDGQSYETRSAISHLVDLTYSCYQQMLSIAKAVSDVDYILISGLINNHRIPSVLCRCCFGSRKGIRPVKN